MCVWYQVESICREVAYLRTLLQSKHRQLQELVNNQGRAQTYQQRWEKVRNIIRNLREESVSVIRTHIANDAMYTHTIYIHIT